MRVQIDILAFVLLSSLPICAQKTWVVDAARGAGYHFADIQPAFDAAKPGDTVIVRKGAYYAATTSKGLRLFGVTGITFKSRLFPKQVQSLIVKNLPAGQSFVMKGFGVSNFTGRLILLLQDNLGLVHLEDLQLSIRPFLHGKGLIRPAFSILRCKQVSVTGGSFIGRPGLLCDSSTVAMTTCSLFGLPGGQYRYPLSWGGDPALTATFSNLTIAQCSATGGDGLTSNYAIEPSAPALILKSCTLRISGDKASTFKAGVLSSKQTGMHAVESASGKLLVDPRLQLVARGNAPKVKGSATFERMASLQATAGPPGGTLSTQLYSMNGSVQILAASLPVLGVRLPFGELWIDPGNIFLLDSGTIGASEYRRILLPIPKIQSLQGMAVALQAINRLGSNITLSNPVVVVLY